MTAGLARAACALALLAAAAPGARAQSPRGTVDTLTFWSQALGTHKRALVWRPPSYAAGRARYPVAYYLHGLWGSEGDWIRQGALDRTLDSLAAAGRAELLVVMPDGDDGWYTTWNALLDVATCRAAFVPRPGDERAEAYCVPWPHYDDYVARDLVAAVDARYRTRPERAGRAIAGLSMGGYGAVSLALRYPETFRAAASHSGVVSPRYAGAHPFDGTVRYASTEHALRAGWGERLWPLLVAPFGRDSAAWASRDPVTLAQRLAGGASSARRPAIFLDCGTEDGLVDQSRALRAELARLGWAVAYAEWPGGHDWPYWRRHAAESVGWIVAQLQGASP